MWINGTPINQIATAELKDRLSKIDDWHCDAYQFINEELKFRDRNPDYHI